jgi:hypothetical protein
MEIGDSVGKICKRNRDGKEIWELVEDKISKITVTKKYSRRYFTKYVFYPLDAEEVDKNTEDMENAVGKGYIITREVFGLNEITRPFAERWVSWANENPEKAVGLLEA